VLGDGPIETYLRRLGRELRGNPLLARRILEEARDHLALAAEREERRGCARRHAEEAAVMQFGSASEVAGRFDRFVLPFRLILLVASLATLVVGAWLIFVITVVLPARDPGHIAFWRLVALGFFAYAGLTWACLLRGPREPWLRFGVLAASTVAIGAGIYGIASAVHRADAGGHFEGYLVLMGVILAAHGLSAVAYTALASRLAGRIAAR